MTLSWKEMKSDNDDDCLDGVKYVAHFHDMLLEVYRCKSAIRIHSMTGGWEGREWAFLIDGLPHIPAYFKSKEIALDLAEKCAHDELDWRCRKDETPCVGRCRL